MIIKNFILLQIMKFYSYANLFCSLKTQTYRGDTVKNSHGVFLFSELFNRRSLVIIIWCGNKSLT